MPDRLALELVNTAHERWREPVETLRAPADLARWFVHVGLADAPMPVSRRVLEEARELREAIDAVIRATVAGEPAPPEAIAGIDDWLVHAGSRPALVLDEHGRAALSARQAADSPRRALGTIALDAAAMLGTEAERERVRICAGEECGARFFDRSPAGRRRWCSMRRCGNVAKARRHRARVRESA